MNEVTLTLPPEVWNALILGGLSPLLHYVLQRLVKFSQEPRIKSLINWCLAIGIPVAASVVVALLNNAEFIKAVPAFPVIFATSQVLYFAVIRAWRRAWELDGQLQSVDKIIVQGGLEPAQEL